VPPRLRSRAIFIIHYCHYNDPVPFAVRDYKPEDFEALWRLDQECFPPDISYSRPELRAYMRRRGSFTLVATAAARGAVSAVANDDMNRAANNLATGNEENRIAGFLVAHSGSTGHIITIDVAAHARRLGVGSQLLRTAEDRLRSAGSRAVGLETAVDNLNALGFYKRHGYNVIKTWPRYYSNGVDALVMRKELV
jgi:ribosomal-protein-alanine N-acetyltransferase